MALGFRLQAADVLSFVAIPLFCEDSEHVMTFFAYVRENENLNGLPEEYHGFANKYGFRYDMDSESGLFDVGDTDGEHVVLEDVGDRIDVNEKPPTTAYPRVSHMYNLIELLDKPFVIH